MVSKKKNVSAPVPILEIGSGPTQNGAALRATRTHTYSCCCLFVCLNSLLFVLHVKLIFIFIF